MTVEAVKRCESGPPAYRKTIFGADLWRERKFCHQLHTPVNLASLDGRNAHGTTVTLIDRELRMLKGTGFEERGMDGTSEPDFLLHIPL
jgi:hypothetical protein